MTMCNNGLLHLPRLARGAFAGAFLLILGIQGASAGSQQDMGSQQDKDVTSGIHHEHHDMSATDFSFGKPGKSAKVDRVVTITMGDANFTPASVDVTTGQTIRFVVMNKSEIDHDFTIGDAKTQSAHRAEMAQAMKKGMMEHGDDPNAIFVKAGQQRELIWKFTRAGSLEFDCNVPGHYEAGMKGVITVRSRGNADAGISQRAAPASSLVMR